ncbi:DUF6221 family protein [Kitasatospora griseola]|uniref:DUF6221 family protein n=1 Tax=Kitasatospora griseola TaxID=2064 RepID=UPI00366A2737
MATADLVAFLRARLDEDEQTAREAHAIDPAPWYEDVEYDDRTNQRDGRYGSGLVRADDNVALWDRKQSSTLSMTAPTAVHVARHDPARVLAEVAAKRRILDDLAAAQGLEEKDPWEAEDRLGALERAVSFLALPYADHPDYRPEWAPGA